MNIFQSIVKKILFSLLVFYPLCSVLANNVTNDTTDRDHPFLFFSEQDIHLIRERINKEPFSPRWELLIKNADYIVDKPIQKVQLGKNPELTSL